MLGFGWGVEARAQTLDADPIEIGESAHVVAAGMTPGSLVVLHTSRTGPGAAARCPRWLQGPCLGLVRSRPVASVRADAAGAATFDWEPPHSGTWWFQALGGNGAGAGAGPGIAGPVLELEVGVPGVRELGTDGIGNALGQAHDYLGDAVAGADYDGDGVPELVVGLPRHDGGGSLQGGTGSAWIFHAGLPADAGIADADAVVVGVDAANRGTFGDWVGTLPDLNGDGLPELAIGDAQADQLGDNGAVYVWYGVPADGADADTADLVVYGGTNERVVSAAAGELTGDGILDLVLPMGDGNGARVVAGPFPSGTRIDAGVTYTARISRSRADVDLSRAAVGDFDGDGVDDLALGASTWADPALGTVYGRVYVEHGPIVGEYDADLDLDATITGDDVNGRLGSVVQAADLDGDGVDELVVGSDRYPAATNHGKVWVFSAPFQGAVALGTATATIEGRTTGQQIASSILCPGDLDADGHADLLVGSEEKARAWWFRGPLLGAYDTDDAATEIRGNTNLANLGARDAMVVVPDVTGDRRPDLWLGEPERNVNGTDSGAVTLLPGAW